MTYPVEKTEEEWAEQLGPDAYRILRKKGTEKPFSGAFDRFDGKGKFVCKGCGQELFDSETKFDAGCGWPSFYKAAEKGAVEELPDHSHGMHRTEVLCASCGGHLGHVFPDGYGTPTGMRYCINSLSLDFREG